MWRSRDVSGEEVESAHLRAAQHHYELPFALRVAAVDGTLAERLGDEH